jgi:hypothetical protein
VEFDQGEYVVCHCPSSYAGFVNVDAGAEDTVVEWEALVGVEAEVEYALVVDDFIFEVDIDEAEIDEGTRSAGTSIVTVGELTLTTE